MENLNSLVEKFVENILRLESESNALLKERMLRYVQGNFKIYGHEITPEEFIRITSRFHFDSRDRVSTNFFNPIKLDHDTKCNIKSLLSWLSKLPWIKVPEPCATVKEWLNN